MEGEMKREVMRRRSIETQQIASWKKEQILQDIENLKSGSLGQSTSGASSALKLAQVEPSTPSNETKMLSKLSARKIKNLVGNNGSGVQLNFDSVVGKVTEHHSKPKYNVGFDLPAEVPPSPYQNFPSNNHNSSNNVSNAEVESMIQEKKYFLSRLNDDNNKMVQMLEDMKDCKLKLKQAIESVEAERDRLKGYQVDISGSCIDQYLMDGSEGSLSSLMAFQNSDMFHRMTDEQQEERRLAAEEMQRAMLSLVARHKANQHEQNELVFGRIQAMCTRFTQDFQSSADSFEGEIAQLRAVIDVAGPSLVSTGDQLSQNIIDAMIDFVASNKVVSAAASRSNVMLKDPSKSAMKVAELNASNRNNEPSMSQAEIDELVASNEALKASLAKMSKSNAQLRAAAATPGSKKSALKKVVSNNSIGTNKDDYDEYEHNENNNSKHNISTGSISLPATPSKPKVVLPTFVSENLHSHLSKHIEQLLEGHPIAATNIPSDVIVETAKELATQVLSLATTAFVSFAHHKGIEDLLTHPALQGVSAVTAITDAYIRSVIGDGVKHMVQVAAVHAEISTLTTLYLTYLHSRFGSNGKINNNSVTASAPVSGPPSVVSPIAASGTPNDYSTESRDESDYDPTLYSGFNRSGSTDQPFMVPSSNLGQVSHGAKEFNRSQSSSAIGNGAKNLPRYMMPKSASTTAVVK